MINSVNSNRAESSNVKSSDVVNFCNSNREVANSDIRNVLTNWKSTCSEKKDLNNVDNTDNNINVNFSSHYDEALFSPRLVQPNRGGNSEKNTNNKLMMLMISPRMGGMDRSDQEIEIHLSPGKKKCHFNTNKYMMNRKHGN